MCLVSMRHFPGNRRLAEYLCACSLRIMAKFVVHRRLDSMYRQTTMIECLAEVDGIRREATANGDMAKMTAFADE